MNPLHPSPGKERKDKEGGKKENRGRRKERRKPGENWTPG